MVMLCSYRKCLHSWAVCWMISHWPHIQSMMLSHSCGWWGIRSPGTRGQEKIPRKWLQSWTALRKYLTVIRNLRSKKCRFWCTKRSFVSFWSTSVQGLRALRSLCMPGVSKSCQGYQSCDGSRKKGTNAVFGSQRVRHVQTKCSCSKSDNIRAFSVNDQLMAVAKDSLTICSCSRRQVFL